MRFARIIVLAMLSISVLGCSKKHPVGDVSGKVSFDGKEIQEGSIQFIPIDGKTRTAGTVITNGAFQAAVPVNKVRVEIYAAGAVRPKARPAASKAAKEEPIHLGTSDSSNHIMPDELIPPKYNLKSELTLDVKPGDNPVKYDLTTK